MNKFFTQKRNITFVIYAVICMILMNLSYSYPDKFNAPRATLIQTITPVLKVFSLPSYWLNNSYNNIILHFNVVEKNKNLKHENSILYQWYKKSMSLELENQRLRTLLGATHTEESSPLIVQPFTDANSPFARSILIGAGKNSGVEKGQEVVNHQGLVGRIIEVFPNTSRVLLITDYTFRLPARILETRSRALIKGTNSPQMEIMLVENAHAKIHPEMTVVTSGMGGAFMPDIPIGKIRKSGDSFIIIPDVDFSKLENIVVHRHKVSHILEVDND